MVYADDQDEALEQLIAQYGDYILKLCGTILLDRTAAEDAWQDTWIKVWKRLSSFEGKSSPKTWITRIAINTCRDVRRSAWFRRERTAENVEGLERWRAPVSTSGGCVTEAIRALPMRDREIVTLYYMEGLSIKELAETLGIHLNTAASRLRRGREKLKTILEGGTNRE